MLYLFSQMLLSLLLAGALGAAVAWWVRGVRARAHAQTLQKLIQKQQRLVAQADNDIRMVNEDYDELKRQSVDTIQELTEENRQIPLLRQNLDKSQALVRQMMQKSTSEAPQRSSPVALRPAPERNASPASATTSNAPSTPDPAQTKTRPHGLASRVARGRRTEPAKPPSGHPTEQAPGGPATQTISTEQPAPASLVKNPTRRGWASSSLPDVDDVPAAEPKYQPPVSAAPVATAPATRAEPLFDAVEPYDDLQQIVGIGPLTEQGLNRLGITTYSQLAHLGSQDIDKIAEALEIGPNRIVAYDWVGSARQQLEDVLEEL